MTNETNLIGHQDKVFQNAEISVIEEIVSEVAVVQRDEIDKIKSEIDLSKAGNLVTYGSGAQRDIANFSNQILASIKTKDSGEVGNLLTSLVSEARSFEATYSGPKAFIRKLPLVGRLFGKAENMVTRYNSVSSNIDNITSALEKAKNVMTKDIVLFDEFYKKNLDYFKRLELYIIAGDEKIEEIHNEILPKLRQDVLSEESSLGPQALADFESEVARFEKKVHDLKLSKTIALQTAPQIRLIQNNDKILIDRVQGAIYNTIPLWKNQFIITLGLQRQEQVLQLQRNVSDMTNELLKKNAALLKQNTVNAAIENNRGIVDVETVKKVNEDLIGTLEEIIKIQNDGRAQRAIAEQEIVQIEDRLKEALLNSRGM